MGMYVVHVREECSIPCIIEAATEADAIEAINDGEGEYLYGFRKSIELVSEIFWTIEDYEDFKKRTVPKDISTIKKILDFVRNSSNDPNFISEVEKFAAEAGVFYDKYESFPTFQ